MSDPDPVPENDGEGDAAGAPDDGAIADEPALPTLQRTVLGPFRLSFEALLPEDQRVTFIVPATVQTMHFLVHANTTAAGPYAASQIIAVPPDPGMTIAHETGEQVSFSFAPAAGVAAGAETIAGPFEESPMALAGEWTFEIYGRGANLEAHLVVTLETA
jgi:hypothetical protein